MTGANFNSVSALLKSPNCTKLGGLVPFSILSNGFNDLTFANINLSLTVSF